MENIRREVIGLFICFILLSNGSVYALNINYMENPKVKDLEVEKRDIKELKFDLTLKILQRIILSPSLTVCSIKNDSIVWSKFYGFSKLYRLQRPNENTIYPVGSVTKSVTTTAMLQLYERRYYDLDDDICNYSSFRIRNPNYPDVPITFRMLLSHTSSLFDYSIFDFKGLIYTLLSQSVPDDAENFLKENIVEGGKHYNEKYWQNYPPGENARYSNIGFLIVVYLFERIANQTIEEYCQQNIFKPLEMYNTSYHPSNLNKDQMASIYIKHAGVFLPIPNYDAKAMAGVGGLRTTLEDLSHYLIAHMNKGVYKENRILNESTIELMHNCIYYDTLSPKQLQHIYGLGWWSKIKFNREIQGHGGMCPGATCFMMMNETNKIGVIIMTNQFNIFTFFQLIRYIIQANTRYIIAELLFKKALEFD